MALTKYQKLIVAQSKQCKGTGSAATVREAASAYIKDAVTKGKTKTEAERIAKKVTSSCKGIGAARRKKRTTAKRKTKK